MRAKSNFQIAHEKYHYTRYVVLIKHIVKFDARLIRAIHYSLVDDEGSPSRSIYFLFPSFMQDIIYNARGLRALKFVEVPRVIFSLENEERAIQARRYHYSYLSLSHCRRFLFPVSRPRAKHYSRTYLRDGHRRDDDNCRMNFHSLERAILASPSLFRCTKRK